MHVLRVLTFKTIAKNTWTYAINSGGIIYSSLPIITNRISLFVLTYLIVVSVPAEKSQYI
jgi:hypothetical protein